MSWASARKPAASGSGLSVGVGSARPAEAPDGSPTEAPTRHTCNDGRGPFFGRKTPGCPRCDELLAGAEPRQLPAWKQALYEEGRRRRDDDAERAAAIRAHFAPGGPHSRANCGPVCTFGDW
jgi:hypothetical protein